MGRRPLAMIGFLALAAFAAPAQDGGLPPGVLLLSKVKRHVRQQLEQLPEYTCLETVERSSTQAQGGRRGKAGDKALSPLDTIRLEILYSGHKELYASPGAGNFREENPGAFIASGMIGDGIFASQLQTIFVSETAIFTYRGEETVAHDRGWSSAVKYDFRISAQQSGWSVNLQNGSGVIGEQGSFWADPDSLDLLRLEIHAADIPPGLPIKDVVVIANYGRMRIGDGDVMLPQTADLRLILSDGEESLDQFDFTHCRSYRAQSSISFDSPDAPSLKPPAGPSKAPAASPGPQAVGTLPAGLAVPITLVTALDSGATVGTLIEGKVSTDVEFRGQTVIPKGSPVRGRVRRLEHYTDAGGYFVTGLEFTEVDVAGAPLRFYADLKNASGAPGLEWLISTAGMRRNDLAVESHTENVRIPDLPGVGSFFLRRSSFAIPAGFQMEWKTREYGK